MIFVIAELVSTALYFITSIYFLVFTDPSLFETLVISGLLILVSIVMTELYRDNGDEQ